MAVVVAVAVSSLSLAKVGYMLFMAPTPKRSDMKTALALALQALMAGAIAAKLSVVDFPRRRGPHGAPR